MSTPDDSDQPKEVFISYVSEDASIRDELVKFLDYIRVASYYDRDPANIKPGHWAARITAAIIKAKLVLVIFTRHFAAKPRNNAIPELETALDEGVKCFPLWMDQSEIPDEQKHVLKKGMDGIQFYKSDPNPYRGLYEMLRNVGVAVLQDVDLSLYSGKPATAFVALDSVKVDKEGGVDVRLSPSYLSPLLAGWFTADALTRLLTITAGDDREIADLIQAGLGDDACRCCAENLKAQVSFANLRLSLICNLIVAARDGGGEAVRRAMACAVALRSSPCLTGAADTDTNWEATERALDSLAGELKGRFCSVSCSEARSWTLDEEIGFEKEVAGVMANAGGVTVSINGRPTAFAFGPVFAEAYDASEQLRHRAVVMDDVRDLLAFSPIGMPAFLWRQARHHRVLATCAALLGEYLGMPHHVLHGAATRILTDSALTVVEETLDLRRLDGGADACNLGKHAIHWIHKADQCRCLTDDDRARLCRALAHLGDTLDTTTVSPWLLHQLEDILSAVESLGHPDTNEPCQQIRLRAAFCAAADAYDGGDYQRARGLMAPFIKALDVLSESNLETLFNTLTQLAVEAPNDCVGTVAAVVEELGRRGGDAAEHQTREDILQRIRQLAGRDEQAWFEEALQRHQAAGDGAPTEELYAAVQAATSKYVDAGDAEAAIRIATRLPQTMAHKVQQILVDLVRTTNDDRVAQRLTDYLFSSFTPNTAPQQVACSNKRLEPSDFAEQYTVADMMERSTLRARVRCVVEELLDRDASAEAASYIAAITEAVPDDVLVQQLGIECRQRWSATLPEDPDELRHILRDMGLPGQASAKARVDVDVPEPAPTPFPASPWIDREREAVLALLDKLESHQGKRSPGGRPAPSFEPNRADEVDPLATVQSPTRGH